jgi:hypothetical protein
MHTYWKSENSPLWTVGYWVDGSWHPLSDHANEQEAMRRVNFLNGGNGRDMPPRALG